MKKIILSCAFIGMFLLGACGSYIATADQTHPLKIWAENDNGDYHTLVVVDGNTNVNYVVVSTDLGGGNRSIAITPRMNADGSLYTSN